MSSEVASNIWLSEWTNDPVSSNGTQDITLRDLRLGVYGALGGAQGNTQNSVSSNITDGSVFHTMKYISKNTPISIGNSL